MSRFYCDHGWETLHDIMFHGNPFFEEVIYLNLRTKLDLSLTRRYVTPRRVSYPWLYVVMCPHWPLRSLLARDPGSG